MCQLGMCDKMEDASHRGVTALNAVHLSASLVLLPLTIASVVLPSSPSSSTMSPTIVECLAASLSADPNARMTAELKINELLPNPGKFAIISCPGVIITRRAFLRNGGDAFSRGPCAGCRHIITTDEFFAVRVRVCLTFTAIHSACIMLRKYINERWSPYFQSYKGSAPSQEVGYSYCLPDIFSLFPHRQKSKFGWPSSKACQILTGR